MKVAGRQPSSLRQQGAAKPVRASAGAGLKLLGGFELELGRRAEEIPPHVQRLLAFLALHDRPLRRTYVSGRLWLDASQEQAFGSLRTTVWRVRRVAAPMVHATSTHLALDPSVVVDARELESAADRIRHPHQTVAPEDVERLAEAEELLPDWYDDWVLQERERLGQLRLAALETVCEELVETGRFREATAAAQAAVSADPLRESARRLLISTCLCAGNRAEALRQFVDFRTLLAREVGLEPSFRMLELTRTFKAAAG
jgi:DNA-binding SARP family transcriptional activator